MTATERKLVREISIFLAGFGALLLLLSTAFLAAAPAATTTQGSVLGWVAGGLGGIQVLSGILLALTRKALWGVVGAVANALVSLSYFVWVGLWLAVSGQQFQPNLMMALALLMPILLGRQVARLLQTARVVDPLESVRTL